MASAYGAYRVPEKLRDSFRTLAQEICHACLEFSRNAMRSESPGHQGTPITVGTTGTHCL